MYAAVSFGGQYSADKVLSSRKVASVFAQNVEKENDDE
jgi:hypothetical protein